MKPDSGFYRTQRAHLTRIVADMRVPPSRVEDVVQEAWLEAVKYRKQFHGEDVERQLRCWLEKVIHSKAVNMIRRLDRRRAESLDALPAEPMDRKEAACANSEEEQERREWLARKLTELRKEDPLNGRLLYGHFLKKRSIEELAAKTGLTVHAIHCRISRVIKKLRGRWSECRPDGEAAP